MNKKLLMLLEKYNNVPPSFDFIKEVYTVLSDYYDVNEYFNRVVVSDGENIRLKKYRGLYDPYLKEIEIDISTFKDKSNSHLLLLLIHEFCHVLQAKNQDKRDFESYLYDISMEIDDKVYLSDFHNLVPIERLANIRSNIWLTDILSLNYNSYKTDIIDFRKQLYLNLIKDYTISSDGELMSPFERILDKTNLNGCLKRLKFYNDNREIMLANIMDSYSLSERIYYGLPIKNSEYLEIYNLYCQNDNKKRILK